MARDLALFGGCLGVSGVWIPDFLLVDFDYLAGNAAGYLVGGEGLDMLCLEAGDALGGLYTNGDFGFLRAFNLRVDEHVLLQCIDVGIGDW